MAILRFLVPGTGIEPVQPKAERFSSHYGFHRRRLPFVRWTMPSPWRMRVRCPPSSLYTFPFRGLARCCLAARAGGSPNLTEFTRVLSPPCAQCYKSLVSTNFTIPARDEGVDFTRIGQMRGQERQIGHNWLVGCCRWHQTVIRHNSRSSANAAIGIPLGPRQQ